MTMKLSMLTAVAVIAMPVAAGAQASYGSNSAPKAQQSQSDADAGLTPAEKASKKSARSKTKAPSDVAAQDAPATTAAPATDIPQKTAPATQAQKPMQPATAPAGTATSAPSTSTTTTTDEAATPQGAAPGQTQATPGQSQASPGQASQLTPAVTGETPSGQPVPSQAADQAQAGQIAKATAADIKAGVSVYDQKGGLVGKIVSSSAKGAVIDTGTVKATVAAASFAKSDKGLVIGMTKSEIEAAAKPSTAKATKKPD